MIKIRDIKNNVDILSKKYKSFNIDSIFIEQNSKLDKILYKEEQLHALRSASKLLVAFAVGIAIKEGKLSLELNVYDLIKNVCNIYNKNNLPKIKRWTIRNLLTHTTGYDKQIISNNELKNIDIDYTKILDYVLNYDIQNEVGEKYIYNNVEPFLISVIFSEYLNINLKDYVKEKIFDKMDIKEFKWDSFGRYCKGGTGLYLKPSDFHKIGQLLLNNGYYNGTPIIPSDWVQEMCKPQIKTESVYKKERVLPKINGGYFTFLSRDGYIFRDGALGQYIIINKENDLLITIMSSEKEMKNVTEIIRNIL